MQVDRQIAPDPRAVEDLSAVIEKLDETPNNVPQILKAVTLMGELGMASEQFDMLSKLSDLVMLGTEQWKEYFNIYLSTFTLSMDTVTDALERFHRAELDYQGDLHRDSLIRLIHPMSTHCISSRVLVQT